jgi:hypothetical protein
MIMHTDGPAEAAKHEILAPAGDVTDAIVRDR